MPVAAWSGGPVESVDAAAEHARAIGYPVVIKARAGGGGRGIHVAASEEELASAFERARAEALRRFADATIFIERLVVGARHVEVQVVADHHGAVWAAGVRDCSIQRCNQKLIEESSSPALGAEQERELRAAAVDLARAAGYRNAGTVEFLYQPDERSFAFLEVNPRLQIEHPVTEATTGLDLVKLQLHVAAGGRLEGEPPPASGHAIEARLNAEDPERGFAPAPGTVELLDAAVRAGGPGRHRRRRGRRHRGRVRLDGRQGHRLGPRPRGGEGPVAPRSGGDDRGRARGDDEQGVPARSARPPGDDRRHGRHRLAGPPRRLRTATSPTRNADVALLAAAIDIVRLRGGARAPRLLRRRRSRPAPGEPRDRPDGRPPPPRADLPPRRRADGPPSVQDRGRRRDRRRAGRAPPPLRAPARDRRRGVHGRLGHRRSRSSRRGRGGRPIACRETRAGSCGPPRRRSSWP